MFLDGSYPIIGAAMRVHAELGPGLLEVTYQRALALELDAGGVLFRREVPVPVWYRGKNIGTFRADFECDQVLLELKALPFLGEGAVAQLAHYLTATGKPVGLLLNFGTPSLQIKRVLPRRSALCGPPDSLNSVAVSLN
ncbi:MAG TPA: GxxExxY protein [Candidatus Thermoplasmatota archaeon]|nr:GxxExxY protein [Candidatus Thermoplasmatota archaeon]